MTREDQAECPYCGASIEICPEGDWGAEEDQIYCQECPKCEKMFCFTVSYSVTYRSEKAPCLNSGEHDYYTSTGFAFNPDSGAVEATRYRKCRHCKKIEELEK